MSNETTYTIQAVARLSGLPESTLRYYERAGVLPAIDRDPSSGHRVYYEADLDVVSAAACLAATGMSIDEMRHYMSNAASGQAAAAEQIELLTERQQHLVDEVAYLKLQQQYIKVKITYWEAVAADDTAAVATIKKQAATIAEKMKAFKHK